MKLAVGLLAAAALALAVCCLWLWISRKNLRRDVEKTAGALAELLEKDSDGRLMVFTGEDCIRRLLSGINRVLEEKQKLKADFYRAQMSSRRMLSNISHDIRTPLTVLLGYLEIMRMREDGRAEETRRQKENDSREEPGKRRQDAAAEAGPANGREKEGAVRGKEREGEKGRARGKEGEGEKGPAGGEEGEGEESPARGKEKEGEKGPAGREEREGEKSPAGGKERKGEESQSKRGQRKEGESPAEPEQMTEGKREEEQPRAYGSGERAEAFREGKKSSRGERPGARAGESRADMLQKAEEKAEQVLEMAGQFFLLAKLEAGDTRMERLPVCVDELCRSAVLAYYEILTEKKFEVEAELPEGHLFALGDAQGLSRVLENLISNAVRYGADGRYLKIGAARQGEWVKIQIRDRGKGISREALPFIFDRLYTTEDSRNKDRQGSGLGLAIARSLTEQMGGRIEADSRPGEGACFTVWLKHV